MPKESLHTGLLEGMEQNMEYHDIYSMVREKVIETMAITLLPLKSVPKAIEDNILSPKHPV